MWSVLEAGRPVGSPVTTGTPTAPTTTLATSGSLRPGGTVSTAGSSTTLVGPGINRPLLACKVVITTRMHRTVASPTGSPIAESPVTATITVTAATMSAGGTTTGAPLAALA